MRKVVINSTPLLVLGNIGRLDILRELYGKYILPKLYSRKSQKRTMLQVPQLNLQLIGYMC